MGGPQTRRWLAGAPSEELRELSHHEPWRKSVFDKVRLCGGVADELVDGAQSLMKLLLLLFVFPRLNGVIS
jgi:hypothetical protein